ncbi:MAG: PepSY domain-containing protein [Alphaproteobacteria bacterium]
MKILAAAFALTFAMATSAFADDRALTEQEIEGVQKAIQAMGCTVADSEIEAEKSGYEAEDVICDRKQYEVYLDKDFKVIKKVKED